MHLCEPGAQARRPETLTPDSQRPTTWDVEGDLNDRLRPWVLLVPRRASMSTLRGQHRGAPGALADAEEAPPLALVNPHPALGAGAVASGERTGAARRPLGGSTRRWVGAPALGWAAPAGTGAGCGIGPVGRLVGASEGSAAFDQVADDFGGSELGA
ncbi:hypothetical protein GCM10009827_048570 [Dactylosporangium maewongense]|uniref:Uncharacterized protein n=1 Tax=Dactylosporangium maewongense TaxID=634393 RepID=A0ABP4LKN2_9ACTN